MNSKLILAIVVGLIVIGVVVFIFMNNSTNTNNNSTKTFSLSEVAEHNSRSDCWLVIEGSVYDVTGYIGVHPGGTQILQGCGKDATSMFNARSGGGTHSETARNTMKQYLIGTLE